MPIVSSRWFGALLVSVIFSISVVIRAPYLNSSLGDHHEWITAHALIVLENYDNFPLTTHFFRLISSYPNNNNRYVFQDSVMRHMDQSGIGYYTSYPPFAIIFAYVIFRIFNIPTTIMSLQLLNLFLHGLTSILLFLILHKLSTKQKTLSAVLGTTIYIFAAPNLWFLSVTYSWDIFWFYLVIVATYILTRIINAPRPQLSDLILLGLVVGLTILSELQGIFFSFAIIIGAWLFKIPHRFKIIKTVFVGSCVAVSAFLLHTSLTINLISFAKYMFGKFFVSYGTLSHKAYEINNPTNFWQIYQPLIMPTFVIFLLIALAFLVSKSRFNQDQKYIISIGFIPAMLHVIFMFPDIITHEFALVLLIITVSVMIGSMVGSISTSSRKLIRYSQMSLLTICITIYAIISTANFQSIYYWATFGNESDQYEVLAQNIKQIIRPGEVLLIQAPFEIPPMVTYYLKQNHRDVPDRNKALEYMSYLKTQQSLFVVVNEQMKITGYEHLSPPQ